MLVNNSRHLTVNDFKQIYWKLLCAFPAIVFQKMKSRLEKVDSLKWQKDIQKLSVHWFQWLPVENVEIKGCAVKLVVYVKRPGWLFSERQIHKLLIHLISSVVCSRREKLQLYCWLSMQTVGAHSKVYETRTRKRSFTQPGEYCEHGCRVQRR